VTVVDSRYPKNLYTRNHAGTSANPGSKRHDRSFILEIFYRDGIKGTDVTKVIERAGVSESLFYQNFSSKEDLVLAFLHKRHDIFTEGRTLGLVQCCVAGNPGTLRSG
jgi:hypothetical protein